MNESESESDVTTDGQSVSLYWNKAPIWGLRLDLDLYCCLTVAGFLTWGALSDDTTNLSFTIPAGPRQHSHSRVRVPWKYRPYCSVSDSRLRFLTSGRTEYTRSPSPTVSLLFCVSVSVETCVNFVATVWFSRVSVSMEHVFRNQLVSRINLSAATCLLIRFLAMRTYYSNF
jgi:hypothetical protein